jgi:hypothetical protein
MASHWAVTKVNAEVASKVLSQGPSPQPEGEGSSRAQVPGKEKENNVALLIDIPGGSVDCRSSRLRRHRGCCSWNSEDPVRRFSRGLVGELPSRTAICVADTETHTRRCTVLARSANPASDPHKCLAGGSVKRNFLLGSTRNSSLSRDAQRLQRLRGYDAEEKNFRRFADFIIHGVVPE